MKASEGALKTRKDDAASFALDSKTGKTEDEADDNDNDDNAPTPKQWSSDWEPTLSSILSTYV